MLATRSLIPTTAFARRHVSSSLKEKIGTIQRRPKPASNPTVEPSSAPAPGSAGSFQPEADAVALVSTETKVKNAALATALVAFCFGVAAYSMNAVGQAGSDPEDPLATLRKEAAVAQERQDRDTKSADEATAMLQQFEQGEFDPDKYDELEEDETSSKPKRPWYKFW